MRRLLARWIHRSAAGRSRPAPASESSERAGLAEITRPGLRRLAGVTLGVAVMTASTYAFPPLYSLRPWKPGEDYVPYWNIIGREWKGEERVLAREREKLERLQRHHSADAGAGALKRSRLSELTLRERRVAVFPDYRAGDDELEPTEVVLENRAAMDHFYRRLTLVELGVQGVVARAAHWGDSLLGDDGLTFAIRRRLQARFGDAGHGFHLLAPFNQFYLHRGLRFRVRDAWAIRCELLFRCERDRRYGLGGVSTHASGGSRSWFATVEEGSGARVSRFELWYHAMPAGGAFDLVVDGKLARRIETTAKEPSDQVSVLEMTDGAHEIEVRAVGGHVRGYGVVLEREGPGVVWDNLAVIGLQTKTLQNQDPEHIAGQVRHRKPDLLVFSLSGNDAQRGVTDLRRHYEEELAQSIRNYRAGRRRASCLILGVTAHGERTESNGIRSRWSVPEMTRIQRKVALAEGCAFLDLFEAMGGHGAVARWYGAGLMGADLGHPTSSGHELLASLIHQALIRAYREFREEVAGQPFPEWQNLLDAAAPRARHDTDAG